MAKILIVDDEARMLDLIALYLKPYGHQVLKETSGADAVERIADEPVDLVILDIMMPDMDGWEVCKEVRSFSDIPVIMLTARDEKEDVVRGLKTGADDYLTKPFDEHELLARIEALLRRSKRQDVEECCGLIWNGQERSLTYEDTAIALTPKEFDTIGLFLRHPGRAFSREEIIETAWGLGSDTEGRTVDTHIRNLREKVRRSGFPVDDHLKTVWGKGYKWLAESRQE
ncbi:response regulator transcription factor [Salisediminibacterium beveridgei]|uniref:Putative transcriptional regulatory protein yclJ n=1 Tax=Salisediminibacterium beveridgei TaxID=632773 RepID=A0A1D7QZA0_9BACI|nr:response regulator transcription factor [Salisediminibacterium beveridgei]AOM84341.1 putative transcriptional regulatory protein yclJ [Salisediminibacterium beveridgei]